MKYRYILLFPGSFSPFTDGHYIILKRYMEYFDRTDSKYAVFIIKSSSPRDGLKYSSTASMIKQLYSDNNKVSMIKAKNPIGECYATVNVTDDSMKGKIKYVFIGSSKDNDERTIQFTEYFKKHHLSELVDMPSINIEPCLYKGREDKFEDKPVSSVVEREDVRKNDFKSFMTGYKYILNSETSFSEKTLRHYFELFRNEIDVIPEKESENKLSALDKD